MAAAKSSVIKKAACQRWERRNKLDKVEAALKMDPETFQKTYLVQKPKPEDENIIFHCQIGKRGARAAETAVTLGYTKVCNYAGGYKEWSEKEGK
ncbi:thiosulfate:glutathione sulfurtransferase isoform X2 [Microcaecilia unicolor]|uniref:Thiosulfate:glutathione sulfurtransferase isoform X2 n=1 Tax=Microcaecilia unicolor TaxID=1415580 RepID=A0A6P7WPI4_9AMPH|nr:thiosulfate:glutathione sulfurtransferase isoform X2 [Microcaecilia unicolor]